MAERKTILFIAKMNEVAKDLNKTLSTQFNVQLCTNSSQVVNGMIEVADPDLALMLLIGEEAPFNDIFTLFREKYSMLPVITIGSQSEAARFAMFYKSAQFQNLKRPIDDDVLISHLRKMLGLDFKMPGQANADVAAAAGGAAAAAAPDEEDNGKRNILIVDDNAATLRSLKSMLDDIYNVQIVPSGVKAMAMIGRKRPDLILLDYEMPVVDGRQTLEMIRAEEEFKDIPVLFLTGVSDKEHIMAVMSLKPKGYLLKPAVREKLVFEIEKALAS